MVLASPETVQRLEKQISGFGSFSGRTKADLWFWLFHNPYNDLNSLFLVLAFFLAVKQQIYGFGSLHKPYNDLNSRFLVLASLLAVQGLKKQICCFGFSTKRTTT